MAMYEIGDIIPGCEKSFAQFSCAEGEEQGAILARRVAELADRGFSVEWGPAWDRFDGYGPESVANPKGRYGLYTVWGRGTGNPSDGKIILVRGSDGNRPVRVFRTSVRQAGRRV